MTDSETPTVSGDTSPLMTENSSGSDNFEDLIDGFEFTASATNDNTKKNNVIVTISETDDDNSVYNSIKESVDDNLPETVALLTTPEGAKVYVVGTAHFSIESQNDVAKTIQIVQPDIVVVELCSSRLNILQLDEETILKEAKNINLEKIMSMIRQNGVMNGIMYILLLNMSAFITKELGMAPGGEFRTAFNEAKKVSNCIIQLGDRPISITLQRALGSLSWWQTIKLGWHLLTSNESISKEDVEKCKQRDLLEKLISEMAGEYPALGEVFVNERDIYLTHSLQYCCTPHRTPDGKKKAPKVVGIVGIGHLPGITKLWNTPQYENISRILVIPPPSVTSRVLKFTIRLSLFSLVGYAAYKCIPVIFKIKNGVVNFTSPFQ